MKIENFELIETKGESLLDRVYVAEVDVTTGFLKKKTERKRIQRSFGSFWFFVDTGEFTPLNKVEALARSYSAKTGKKC